MISSTGVACQLGKWSTSIHIPLTELFRPLKESLSHFKNSWDGGLRWSSDFADLAGGTDLVVVGGGGLGGMVPFMRGVACGPKTLAVEGDGVIGGRLGFVTAADGFPLDPTVVQALPDDATAETT
jgi:hypothetical protein